ncbi:MAG: hypothetical protein EOP10_03070 [Proteobacteria bacterium]|nr:MAG: hypothetical protein EOP10_03070 [Pseudomonadota bacterium]
MLKNRLMDGLLLAVSAWAVVATSKKQDQGEGIKIPKQSTSIEFFAESTCENAMNASGDATVIYYPNGGAPYLAIRSQSDFGLPASEALKDESGNYTIKGKDRTCQTVDFWSIEMQSTFMFACKDEGSTEITCTVKFTKPED